MEKGVYIFILISSSLLLEFAFTSKYKGNFCLFFQYISLTSSYSGSKSISWPHPSFPFGFDLQLYVCVCVCKTLFFINKEYFYSSFRLPARLSGKCTEFPYTFYFHIHNCPHYWHPLPKWYICYNSWTYTGQSLSPKAIVHIRVHC